MKVPFLDLKAQYAAIKPEIQAAVNNILDTAAYALGPAVDEFESNFASYCHAEYSAGLNSGTSALHLALTALGIGPGDEVITTPHTFIATIWAISYTGATPVFADINADTYTISADEITKKITPKTKAILPVHLYGQPADMDAIAEIASAGRLLVIEDAAQAHGAEYKSKRCGSMGDAACFSFYPGKNLGAYGEAGAVVTNNRATADKIKLLRNHSQPSKYYHTRLGYNYRMDGIQGAVLNVKLRHLERWTIRRRAIASRYSEAFAAISLYKIPSEAPYSRHVYHLYELGLPSDRSRDKLQAYLLACGIQAGLHYPIPVHLQQAYSDLGHREGDFPATEKAAGCLISLPIYPEMSAEMVDYVIEKVVAFDR